ncbi:EPIDERMAL PATTERNING FACTOR-like protein 1 isoform X1 [Cannabis sativa]|uniref:EPIDERMAL PATTERNING FACTOR-like protein 1 isoform X1 n=1 Tax=Cannabis sativa TaxID=3483 RepID=UPI0029CA2132|nr:EPIDERMAL PATTERNING FACTOR-like protein 1 isoform X1 [Cannabis sativa]
MNFMSSNTMNSLFNLWVIMLLHLLLSPCSSLSRSHSHIPPISSSRKEFQVLLVEVEEKSRLGSTPPSCHNKCNTCHPCMAVQVPSLPSHEPVRPGVTRTDPVVVLDSEYDQDLSLDSPLVTIGLHSLFSLC